MSVGLSACSPQSPGPPALVPPPPAPAIDSLTPLPEPLPEIAARVDGVPIPTAQLRALVEGGNARGLTPAERPGAYRGALQRFVARELLFQESKNRKLVVGDEAVDAGIAEARKALVTPVAFEAFLKARGFDEASYREDMRKAKSVALLTEQLASQVPSPTDPDVRAYYEASPAEFHRAERVRARHLLIRVPPGTTADQKDAARRRCEDALRKLQGGADFADLARQVSEDPGTAPGGGALGEIARNMVVKPAEDAAFALQPGEVSGVVESEFGFHVIKVEERLPAAHESLAEAAPGIRAKLQAIRANVEVQKLVAQLLAKAKVEILI